MMDDLYNDDNSVILIVVPKGSPISFLDITNRMTPVACISMKVSELRYI
jgi:hypothetical protein